MDIDAIATELIEARLRQDTHDDEGLGDALIRIEAEAYAAGLEFAITVLGIKNEVDAAVNHLLSAS